MAPGVLLLRDTFPRLFSERRHHRLDWDYGREASLLPRLARPSRSEPSRADLRLAHPRPADYSQFAASQPISRRDAFCELGLRCLVCKDGNLGPCFNLT